MITVIANKCDVHIGANGRGGDILQESAFAIHSIVDMLIEKDVIQNKSDVTLLIALMKHCDDEKNKVETPNLFDVLDEIFKEV